MKTSYACYAMELESIPPPPCDGTGIEAPPVSTRSRTPAVVKPEMEMFLPETRNAAPMNYRRLVVPATNPLGLIISLGSIDLEVESAQVETSTCNCGEENERGKLRNSMELRENL
ncbi:putative cyclin-dependent kinase inhibitor 7 [Sesbania bispinosa]|nr:putative cyclin-dependent kinase inhibitor 7 [Sesbania bispinosa]